MKKSPSSATASSGCVKPWMVGGTVILLLSWTTQQLFYDRYDSQLRDLEASNQKYSNAYVSSLQYVNMYFAHSIATGTTNPQALTKAAQENVAGIAASLEPLPITKERKAKMILELMEVASEVSTIEGYNRYIQRVNSFEPEFDKLRAEYRATIESRRRSASFLYLIPYFLGTLLLVRGFWRGE